MRIMFEDVCTMKYRIINYHRLNLKVLEILHWIYMKLNRTLDFPHQ